NYFASIKTRAKYIQGISGERIKAELDKILISENFDIGIRLLELTGLLKFLCPELDRLKKVFHKSKKYHLEGDVLVHSLLVMKALKINDLNLKYAALFHDVGKISTAQKVVKPEGWVYSFHGHGAKSIEIFEKFAVKYKFPGKDKNLIRWLIKFHDDKKTFFDSNPLKQIIYALQDNFNLLLDIWQADQAGNISKPENEWYRKPRMEAYERGQVLLKKISSKKKLVKKLARGGLIMKYTKLKPGPQVGKKIEQVKIQIILGKIKNTRDMKNFLGNNP
ncbi:MAG: HD domain-containing protein, partial [Candidatus Doudnabacteria bacterium]